MAGYLEQNENRISGSFYWSFNPDSGDTGGLLLSWKGAGAGTPNRAKLALLDGLPATLTLTTAQRTPSLFTNLPATPGAASAHALSAAYAESLQSLLEPPSPPPPPSPTVVVVGGDESTVVVVGGDETGEDDAENADESYEPLQRDDILVGHNVRDILGDGTSYGDSYGNGGRGGRDGLGRSPTASGSTVLPGIRVKAAVGSVRPAGSDDSYGQGAISSVSFFSASPPPSHLQSATKCSTSCYTFYAASAVAFIVLLSKVAKRVSAKLPGRGPAWGKLPQTLPTVRIELGDQLGCSTAIETAVLPKPRGGGSAAAKQMVRYPPQATRAVI